MDKTANGKEEIKNTFKPEWNLKINKNRAAEAKLRMGKMNQLSEKLDKLIRYMPDSPSDVSKTVIEVLKFVTFDILVKTEVPMLYVMDYVETRLSNLEKIVNEITEKTNVDLPNVKAEIAVLKDTLNSEDFKKVKGYVDYMLKEIDDYMKKREENDLAT